MNSTQKLLTKELDLAKLAYLVSHPIQYQAPLLSCVSEAMKGSFHVFFQSNISVSGYFDSNFAQKVKWDVPLLDGYRYTFLNILFGRPDHISALLPVNSGLIQELLKRKVEVLWIHGFAKPYYITVTFISLCLGIKVLIRDETQKLGGRRRFLSELLKRIILTTYSKMGVGFLAIGQLNKQYLMELGVDESQIFLVPYAVNNAYFQESIAEQAPLRKKIRSDLNMNSEAPIILFAGKFQQRKRADDLVRAYTLAYKRLERSGGPLPYLLFAGSGTELNRIQNFVRSESLKQVRFLGFQNQRQLAALFGLCDIFVMPSAAEQWGLVVNEVMNAGKPVIVTNECGCGPDLVRHGHNGYIYPVGDWEKLAEHIVSIICDPVMARKMGQCSLDIINSWNYEADIKGLFNALKWCGLDPSKII